MATVRTMSIREARIGIFYIREGVSKLYNDCKINGDEYLELMRLLEDENDHEWFDMNFVLNWFGSDYELFLDEWKVAYASGAYSHSNSNNGFIGQSIWDNVESEQPATSKSKASATVDIPTAEVVEVEDLNLTQFGKKIIENLEDMKQNPGVLFDILTNSTFGEMMMTGFKKNKVVKDAAAAFIRLFESGNTDTETLQKTIANVSIGQISNIGNHKPTEDNVETIVPEEVVEKQTTKHIIPEDVVVEKKEEPIVIPPAPVKEHIVEEKEAQVNKSYSNYPAPKGNHPNKGKNKNKHGRR